MNTESIVKELKDSDSFFTQYSLNEFLDISRYGREEILFGSRITPVKISRQLAYVFAYVQTGNISEAGRKVFKDHATIIHGIRYIYDLIRTKDAILANIINQFIQDHTEVYASKYTLKYPMALASLEHQFFNNQTKQNENI